MKDAFLFGNPASRTALSTAACSSRQVMVICLVVGTLSVVGCGQKGPLTLPKPELQTPSPTDSTPSPPSPPRTPSTPKTSSAPAMPASPAAPAIPPLPSSDAHS